jgi:hypothetical protein
MSRCRRLGEELERRLCLRRASGSGSERCWQDIFAQCGRRDFATQIRPHRSQRTLSATEIHERRAGARLPPPIPWIRTGLLLEFILSLYPATRRSDAYRDEVLAAFGLRRLSTWPLGVLSAGTAKKLLSTAALVTAPLVMLFDEPTHAGADRLAPGGPTVFQRALMQACPSGKRCAHRCRAASARATQELRGSPLPT